MSQKPLSLIIGVGPENGLGAALCRRAAAEGRHVVVAGRTDEKVSRVADAIKQEGGEATSVAMDATLESDVKDLFGLVDGMEGPLDLVVYNAGNNRWGDTLEMSGDFFEETWRVGCLGGFLAGREACRIMGEAGEGTLIFTGATASIRGRPPFIAFAAAKAGLRAVAQSLAREFGPKGVHVAHVIVDGAIDGEKIRSISEDYAASKGDDGMLDIDAMAESYWMLHRQQRSAWTHELDLRPFKETF